MVSADWLDWLLGAGLITVNVLGSSVTLDGYLTSFILLLSTIQTL